MSVNYDQLIADKRTDGSIKNWANNDVIPSSTIAFEAQQILYTRLRCREMLQIYEGVTGTGVDTLELATVAPNFRQPRFFQFTGLEKAMIEKKTVEEVEWAINYDGAGARISRKPTIFYHRGTVLNFETFLDQAYPYRLAYYGALPALDSTPAGKSNFLTNRCFRAFKTTCMVLISEWLKKSDDRIYWAKMASVEIDAENQEADADQYAGVDLVEQVI